MLLSWVAMQSKWIQFRRADLSRFSYLIYNTIYPFIVAGIAYFDTTELAFTFLLIGKWRALAVQPRFWPLTVRSAIVDIMVGVGVIYMIDNVSENYPRYQGLVISILLAIMYSIWLAYVRHKSSFLWGRIQASISLFMAILVIENVMVNLPQLVELSMVVFALYISARHIFLNEKNILERVYSASWTLIGIELYVVQRISMFAVEIVPDLWLSVNAILLPVILYLSSGLVASVNNNDPSSEVTPSSTRLAYISMLIVITLIAVVNMSGLKS